ncbi:MAG: hypothetical protein GY814_03870 [Gammaproteobacteria bacterium]|nr:hypothetical protein [Gammaproteobacteria bacterium]
MSYFKVFIYALLTAPLILFNVSHASTYTTGDLQYNSLTGVMTNQQTQQTYLGWDLISSYTYQDTVDATASGGLYSGYHIADFDEAKTFFEAAMNGSCDVTSGNNTTCDTRDNYYNGMVGDNHGYTTDMAWFLGSNAGLAGAIRMNEENLFFGIPHQLIDDWGPIASSDQYSHIGNSAYQAVPVSWLLVANTTSAVPVPAAIWLFGTALIGLVGYGKRKSKVPV